MEVYFKGFENKPLFFPKEFSLKSLEQITVESFYKDNWHYYEIEETKVGVNDTVIDCGAAEGLFSFIIAARCKEIYAIEPLKEFVSCLKRTFSNNKNVHIIEKALSDKEGKLFITSQGISSQISDKKNGNEIEVITLDRMFFENDIPVSYIKIDLEGYDYHALRG
ncbi:MAG: FkbM family methyltransferase, partial [Elusimicrobiota bacterium]